MPLMYDELLCVYGAWCLSDQLLGELSGLCGPFSKTLLKIRDLLIPAVYSSYAAAKTLAPLQFDQLPWFAVAARLRGDNTMLMAQQECFKQELSRHQVCC